LLWSIHQPPRTVNRHAAYTPDNKLQEHYFVNGIPHVVLIDRSGNVRMFRIGNSPKNAAAIEDAIKEAFAEEPAPASGATDGEKS
jgi:hypothetical protein